jgi:hypothetical protein
MERQRLAEIYNDLRKVRQGLADNAISKADAKTVLTVVHQGITSIRQEIRRQEVNLRRQRRRNQDY